MSTQSVAPPSAGPVRMDRLAVLPVFFKLRRKRAIMAGGSLPAVWKAELLSAAGAEVVIYTDAPCVELVALAGSPPEGRIEIVPRPWAPQDLPGAAIAIGAIEGDEEAEAFRQAARVAGVPVNVIDKPAFCDFQFGTIVARSPLVIGISTDGAAPVFGQAIRARSESLLPQGLTRWAQAAMEWRPAFQALGLDFRARRRFWEVFTARAFDRPDAEPDQATRELCLSEALAERDAVQSCRITLVCAGSGDPDSLTLGAIRALQAADVVVHGANVPPAVVGFARREATKSAIDQNVVTLPAELVDLIAPGRRIAWLDWGDPTICLRWSSRHEALSVLGAVETWTEPGLGLCSICTPACPAWSHG